MAVRQLNSKPQAVGEAPAPLIYPPLTPEEKVRMAKHGISEEEVARDPGLRFLGAFADDPEFMPLMREEFRRSRGREMPE